MNRPVWKWSIMLSKLPSSFWLSELNFSWYILTWGSRIHYECLNQDWITFLVTSSYYHFNFQNISGGEKALKMKILLSKEKKKENPHNLISWETKALLKVINIIKIITQPQKKISQHAFEEGYLNSLQDQLLFVRITMKVNREHWQALFS